MIAYDVATSPAWNASTDKLDRTWTYTAGGDKEDFQSATFFAQDETKHSSANSTFTVSFAPTFQYGACATATNFYRRTRRSGCALAATSSVCAGITHSARSPRTIYLCRPALLFSCRPSTSGAYDRSLQGNPPIAGAAFDSNVGNAQIFTREAMQTSSNCEPQGSGRFARCPKFTVEVRIPLSLAGGGDGMLRTKLVAAQAAGKDFLIVYDPTIVASEVGTPAPPVKQWMEWVGIILLIVLCCCCCCCCCVVMPVAIAAGVVCCCLAARKKARVLEAKTFQAKRAGPAHFEFTTSPMVGTVVTAEAVGVEMAPTTVQAYAVQ